MNERRCWMIQRATVRVTVRAMKSWTGTVLRETFVVSREVWGQDWRNVRKLSEKSVPSGMFQRPKTCSLDASFWVSQRFQGWLVFLKKRWISPWTRIILISACLASLLLSGIRVWGFLEEWWGCSVLEKARWCSTVHCKAACSKGGERRRSNSIRSANKREHGSWALLH